MRYHSSSDQVWSRKLIKDMESMHHQGHNNYPKMVQDANTIFVNYKQDPRNKEHGSNDEWYGREGWSCFHKQSWGLGLQKNSPTTGGKKGGHNKDSITCSNVKKMDIMWTHVQMAAKMTSLRPQLCYSLESRRVSSVHTATKRCQ
jgi:hypothetical protein